MAAVEQSITYPRRILPDPLHYSCKSGEVAKRAEMTQHGNEPMDLESFSPLWLACYQGDFETAQRSLSYNQKFAYATKFNINNHFETMDQVPLLEMTYQGYFSIAKGNAQLKLLFKNNETEYNKHKISSDHLKIIQLLLDNGIDVNIQNIYGYTSLHQVLLHMPETELYASIAPLIKHKDINVNIQNLFGCTALHECMMRMRIQSVKILLDLGANMYIKDNNGIRPIDLTHNHIIIEQLIANQIMKNKKGTNILKNEGTDMCDVCGKRSDMDIEKLFVCIGCNSRKYCSKKCQKIDWTLRGHKANCKSLKENVNNNAMNKKTEINDEKSMESKNDSQNDSVVSNNVQGLGLRFIIQDKMYDENGGGIVRNTLIVPTREMVDGMMNEYQQIRAADQIGSLANEHISRLQGIKDKTNKHIANKTKNLANKNGLELIKAPNGKVGYENKFIVKVQLAKPNHTNPLLKLMSENMLYASENRMTVYNHTRSYIGFIGRNITSKQLKSNNNTINETNKKKNKRCKNNRKKRGKAHSNSNNKHGSNKNNGDNMTIKEQSDNFEKLVEIIRKEGWQQYKIYCYAYVDQNQVLHILQDELVAHQKW